MSIRMKRSLDVQARDKSRDKIRIGDAYQGNLSAGEMKKENNRWEREVRTVLAASEMAVLVASLEGMSVVDLANRSKFAAYTSSA